MALYDLMSYLIPFYDLTLLATTYVCLILTLWMSDSQQKEAHSQVFPIYISVLTSLLMLTFDLFLVPLSCISFLMQ